ncbi:PucR family transcriptional regulator [Hutsoniella sourekii]
MTTIYELLSEPRFSDIKLLTSPDIPGLEIQSVEVSETPDVAYYIPEQAIILTTAMIFQDDQSGLIDYLNSIDKVRVAGLGIKTGRFIGELDPTVINHANQLKIPIFEIPDTYPIGSLLHQFSNVIWQTQQEEINFALDIQKKFSSLLINDAHYDVVIDEFSRTVNSPAILVSPFHQTIVASKHFGSSYHSCDHLVDQTFAQASQVNKKEGTFLITNNQGEKIQVALVPIYVYRNFPHYLIILHSEKIPYPFSSFAIEQVAMVLSFILFKDDKIRQSKQNMETDYFKELIDTQLSDRSERPGQRSILDSKMGYIKSDYYQAILVHEESTVGAHSLTVFQQEAVDVITLWLKYVDHPSLPSNTLVMPEPNGQGSLLILQRSPHLLEEVLFDLASDLRRILDIQIVFSVGNAYVHESQIAESYSQARLAYNERSRTNNRQGSISYYENKGMYQLFNQLNHNEVQYYCRSILKSFAYPEDTGSQDLRDTLKAYLDNQCEIAQTAADLYVHRNTVKYRIQRCEEILGYSVSSPDNSLNLRIALELSEEG